MSLCNVAFTKSSGLGVNGSLYTAPRVDFKVLLFTTKV